MEKKHNIGILGPWGSGNLGDAAIQEAVKYNLKKILHSCEITGLSRNPEDTNKRHKIKSYDISNVLVNYKFNSIESINNKKILKIFIKISNLFLSIINLIVNILIQFFSIYKVVRLLKKLDMLIISGGGQLDDYWGGAWAHPYILIKWSLAAKLAKIPIVFLSVGVDTLNSNLSKIFITTALRLAQYKSFRDNNSQKFISSLGISTNNGVFPDLAYSYQVNSIEKLDKGHDEKMTVGISPISLGAWTDENYSLYDHYLTILVSFCKYLISNDYNVVFFPTQERMDTPIIQKIEAELRQDANFQRTKYIYPNDQIKVEELLYAITKMEIVVASRLHGILLSTLVSKPVLAISCNKKVTTLMNDLGLKEFIIDVNHIEYETLIVVFKKLYQLKSEVGKQLQDTIDKYQIKLHEQYQKISSLLME
jgi:polysaccharide pyruvyl transferase WcaK-like protein